MKLLIVISMLSFGCLSQDSNRINIDNSVMLKGGLDKYKLQKVKIPCLRYEFLATNNYFYYDNEIIIPLITSVCLDNKMFESPTLIIAFIPLKKIELLTRLSKLGKGKYFRNLLGRVIIPRRKLGFFHFELLTDPFVGLLLEEVNID